MRIVLLYQLFGLLKGSCWKQASSQPAPTIKSTCPENYLISQSLCYPVCPDGFHGVGSHCLQICPTGYEDQGSVCAKGEGYMRGMGFTSKFECEQNERVCEKIGVFWQEKCAPGFQAQGYGSCVKTCPEGMQDLIIACQKQQRQRGIGRMLQCKNDEVAILGVCYKKCENYQQRIGNICLGKCPPNLIDCGILCVESQQCTRIRIEESGMLAQKISKGLEGVAKNINLRDLSDESFASLDKSFTMCPQ